MQHEGSTDSPQSAEALILGHYHTMKVYKHVPTGDTLCVHDYHNGRAVRLRRVYAHPEAQHVEAARQARERMACEHRVAGLFTEPPPGIVRVYEFATTPDGAAILVTEDATGGTLRELLVSNALPLTTALDVTRDVATALAVAHERGVIHRNLKPANIWFGDDGRARVANFSLAQVGGDHPAGWQHPGTPLYVSPEQEATTQPLTPASDQYALGLVLFEMLTGAKYRRLDAERATALLAAFPDDVRRLVARMLAAKPAGRFASLTVVAAEIARIRGADAASYRTDNATESGDALPGKMSKVSHMAEPVPVDAPRAPPSPSQAMESGQGDLRRLAEPIPGAAMPAHPPPPAPLPQEADEVERIAEPVAEVPHPPARAPLVPPLFGPRRGLLQPTAGAFAATRAGVTIRDGSISARFLNPGDAAATQWTVGFAFRETPDAAYYLCGVNARGEWFVTAGRHGAAVGAAAPWEIGKSDAIQTVEDGINTLTLTLTGDTARLAVNGTAVAAIDLAAFAPFISNVANAEGDVAIIARCAGTDADGDTSVLYDRWIVTPPR